MALKDYGIVEILVQVARDRYTLEEVTKMYADVLEKQKNGFIYWPNDRTGMKEWVKA